MIKAVTTYDDGEIVFHTSNITKVDTTFEKGAYTCYTDERGKIDIKKFKFSELHKPLKNEVFKNMEVSCIKFFNKEFKKKVNQLGYLHKFGILLYGRTGTSKSSFINYISQKAIDEVEAIVFICDDYNSLQTSINLATKVREIQENPIIFLCDEFERWCKETEGVMKNFLDGHLSIDNTLILAATNYIDVVPETLKNRPSRFRIVQEIGGITDIETIEDIFEEKNKLVELFSKEEIKTFAKQLLEEDATIDDVKNFILDRIMSLNLKFDFKKRPKIGFSKDFEDSRGDEKKDYLNPEDLWRSLFGKDVEYDIEYIQETDNSSNI